MARNRNKSKHIGKIRPYLDISELVGFGNELVSSSRDAEWKIITEEMARVVLEETKKNTPVVTGTLLKHWDLDNKTLQVRAVKGGYSVVLKNNARNKHGYAYGTDVEYGHDSYNQYGGAYQVRHSKYGNNGNTVIGRFMIPMAVANSERKLKKVAGIYLQQWLDRCVQNGK